MDQHIRALIERKARESKARGQDARRRALAVARTDPDAAAKLIEQAALTEAAEQGEIRELATVPVLCDFAAERALLQLARLRQRPDAADALA